MVQCYLITLESDALVPIRISSTHLHIANLWLAKNRVFRAFVIADFMFALSCSDNVLEVNVSRFIRKLCQDVEAEYDSLLCGSSFLRPTPLV